MFGFGTTEIILIVAVLVLFFGAKKIPELIKDIAEAVRSLRGALRDTGSEDAQKDNK